MCGPFTRDLTGAPPGFLEFLEQQKALQLTVGQQPAPPPAPSCDAVDSVYGDFLPQPVTSQLPFVTDFDFSVCQDIIKPDVPALVDPVDASLFNWNLLNDTFAADLAAECNPPVAAASPFPASSDSAQTSGSDCLWDCIPSTPAPLPVKREVVEQAQIKGGSFKQPAASLKRGSAAKPPACKPQSDSDKSDRDCETKDGKVYTEKLPKELLDHPCAATLLSAGIRIKGRTREELLEVAERIKKRRRASAARCRARKASHMHELEDENRELREENMLLRQRIAELTGQASPDLSDFFLDSEMTAPMEMSAIADPIF